MIDRRQFLKPIQAVGVIAAAPVLGSELLYWSDVGDEAAEQAPVAELSGKEVLQALELKARESLGPAGNCAQTSFAVLQEHFGLAGEDFHRALSTFPGIGFRGDTCGAVIGSLMALNLVFGYVASDEPPQRRTAYLKAQEFLRRFEVARGTTTCRGIHEAATGRWHNLMDPAEAQAYVEAGGPRRARPRSPPA
jgi:C_GCAxxG_C_C family probable redox protein